MVKMAKKSALVFVAGVLIIFCIALFSCAPPVGPVRYLPAFVPVDDISKVPKAATVGIPLPLEAIVSPENATVQNISWDINIGSATIEDNTLIASDTGYIILSATIFGGKENNGTLLAKIRARAAALDKSPEREALPKPPPPPEPPIIKPELASAPPVGLNKVVGTNNARIQGGKESATQLTRSAAGLSKKDNAESSSNNINTTNAANRITIKVLSPKISP